MNCDHKEKLELYERMASLLRWIQKGYSSYAEELKAFDEMDSVIDLYLKLRKDNEKFI